MATKRRKKKTSKAHAKGRKTTKVTITVTGPVKVTRSKIAARRTASKRRAKKRSAGSKRRARVHAYLRALPPSHSRLLLGPAPKRKRGRPKKAKANAYGYVASDLGRRRKARAKRRRSSRY